MSIPAETTIGIIGTGNMGMAIIQGLNGHVQPQQLIAYDVDRAKTDLLIDKYGISPAISVNDLVARCNIVIIATKPGLVAAVLQEGKKDLTHEKIVVSIAAGITLADIEQITGTATSIIRIMPNTPALIGEGMTVLSANSNTKNSDLATVETIFSFIGKTMVLPEVHMDAVTALSGSGPAYVFTFIQGLSDAGVKLGIPREKALKLACQTITGSTKLVSESKEDPISLRNKVTSPGGTTIDAVHVLEKAGFSGIIMDAVQAAADKSKKMGG